MYTKIYYIVINSVKTWCGHTWMVKTLTPMTAITMTMMPMMRECLAFNLNRATDNICYYCWRQYKIICVHHFHHLDMFSIFSPSTFGRWFIASILNCCITLYRVDDLYISTLYYNIYDTYILTYMYVCISSYNMYTKFTDLRRRLYIFIRNTIFSHNTH